MAYQSYSAYHSNQSRSDALRPTINTSFTHNPSYEPVQAHDAASPDTSPSPSHMNRPFPPQHGQSSDSVNSGQYYGAGTMGHGDAWQESDDIPLRQHPSNQRFYDPMQPGSKGPQAFVGEAAMTEEERAREGRLRQRRYDKRQQKGIFHKVAWVCWFMTLVQIGVFIGELVKGSILTGSPIQTKPQFNPMIGPSSWVFINMGARYVPCMKDTTYLEYGKDVMWPCPNSTTNDVKGLNMNCTLADLCGLDAKPGQFPIYQWYRFITPIFLHAGIVHILFNLLLQMTLGREIEHLIGSVRFLIVYMASGIFGFVLGGNYAGPLLPSVGCSGALFGITAISLLDLLYTWHKRRRPWVELSLIFLEIVVSFAIGLLPGLDNFSHIGGFLTGLVLGMCLLRSPDKLRKRIRPKSVVPVGFANGSGGGSPVSPTDGKGRAEVASYREFTKKPLGFFQGRKPLWWAWWLVRAGCLAAVTITFIVLITNFYNNASNCSWCRYLSCLDVNNWCTVGFEKPQKINQRDYFETAFPRDL